MAVATHAVRRAPATMATNVIILGAGPFGLGVLQAVRAGGATSVIVTEPSPARLQAATRLGATAAIDPSVDDLRTVVRDLSRHGADLVFDTTGAQGPFNDGVRCLRPRGTLVSVAG